jgi:hypothetical protein
MLVTSSDRVENITSTTKGYLGKLLTRPSVGTFVTSGVNVTVTGGVDLRRYAIQKAWVYSSANNEVRAIQWKPQDTFDPTNKLTLESAFTANVAGDNFVVLFGKYKSLYCINRGGASGVIAGGTLGAGQTLPISEVYRLEPITFDATGTTLSFTLTY